MSAVSRPRFPRPSPTHTPLHQYMNHAARADYFHGMYTNAGNALRPYPIVVTEGDYLVLFYKGQRIMEPFDTMLYHNLKMVCHVPLGITMALMPDLYGTNSTVQLSSSTVATMKSFLAMVNACLADLYANPSRFNSGEQLQRQVRRGHSDVCCRFA